MRKNEYRSFFAECKPLLKLNYFCREIGISPVNLSRFMKGEQWNYELSEATCKRLYDAITNKLQKFV